MSFHTNPPPERVIYIPYPNPLTDGREKDRCDRQNLDNSGCTTSGLEVEFYIHLPNLRLGKSMARTFPHLGKSPSPTQIMSQAWALINARRLSNGILENDLHKDHQTETDDKGPRDF